MNTTPLQPGQCEGVDDASYYWGLGWIDPTEPAYVEGKGVLIPHFLRCVYAAETGSPLCRKHQYLAQMQLAAMPVTAEVM